MAVTQITATPPRLVTNCVVPVNHLSRRCVEGCDQFGSPACPVCPSGQICSLLAPTCDECQRTICVEQTAAPAAISSLPKTTRNESHEVGAIAGGVIAGVLIIAISTYLVWRYCIKAKRSFIMEHAWDDDTDEALKTDKSFTTRRDARSSIHTIASLASTVFTRASNIIQIAYIPGVTNRSCPTTPGFLVPPVPPIPLALTSSYGSTPSFEQEHFFMPSDLRDSTYSTMSSLTSYERNSIASTIYGKNAIISPVSAQTGICGKAAVVSVKSTAPSDDSIPPLPNFDYYSDTGLPSPAFSIGSTFLSRASQATQGKAQVVRVQNSSVDQKSLLYPDVGPQVSQSTSFIDMPISPTRGPFCDPLLDRFPCDCPNVNVGETQSRTTQKRSNVRRTPFGDENQVF